MSTRFHTASSPTRVATPLCLVDPSAIQDSGFIAIRGRSTHPICAIFGTSIVLSHQPIARLVASEPFRGARTGRRGIDPQQPLATPSSAAFGRRPVVQEVVQQAWTGNPLQGPFCTASHAWTLMRDASTLSKRAFSFCPRSGQSGRLDDSSSAAPVMRTGKCASHSGSARHTSARCSAAPQPGSSGAGPWAVRRRSSCGEAEGVHRVQSTPAEDARASLGAVPR